MKKIAIIASSNGFIKNGYGDLLKRKYGAEVDNYSLGSTTSITAVFTLLKVNIVNNYKYVIFDFNLNETHAVFYDCCNYETIISQLIFIVRQFKDSASQPIFLILPNVELPYYCSISYIYRALAKIFDLNIIDLEQIFCNITYDKFVNATDPAHPLPYIQERIFNLLEESLTCFKSVNFKDLPQIEYSLLNLEELSKRCEFSIKRTSHICWGVFSIPMNEVIVIPDNKYLCGIYYWLNATVPYFLYENQEIKLIKNLNLAWKGFYARDIGYSIQSGLRGGGRIFLSSNPHDAIYERTHAQRNNIGNDISSCLYLNNILLCNLNPYDFGLQIYHQYFRYFNEAKKELIDLYMKKEKNTAYI